MKIADLVADLQKAYKEISGGGSLFSRRALVIGGAALAVGLGIFAIDKFGRRPAARPETAAGPKSVSVLIADATNSTGDPLFDGILEQLLAFSLGSAEHISVYEHKQAVGLINKLDPACEGRLTGDGALLISRREGINAVINASIESSKGGYLVKAWAVDAISGKIVAEAGQPIKDRKDILKAPDLLAANLRAGLGVISDASSEALIKETFTTTSLEAMKAYADGQDLDALGKEEEAIAAYLRAIDHDPDFGRAYAGLAVTYYARGEMQLADKYFKESMSRIDQMTDREKHRTRGAYYLSKNNFNRAIEEYTALVEDYPKDVAGLTNLALANFLGYKMPEAFAVGLKACEYEPDNMDNRYNQGWYALGAGDFERAKLEGRKTLEMEPDYPKALVILALADIALGRLEEASKSYERVRTMGSLGLSLSAAGLADLRLYEGRLADAEGLLMDGIALDEENKSFYRAADKSLLLAEAFLAQGKKADAIGAADKAVALNDREEILFAAGRLYCEAGQEDKARKMAAELGKKVQGIHQAYAKLLGGYLSLRRGDSGNAVKLFDEAQAFVDTWLGRFALGRAYLEAGAFEEALAEFEKCEKRRGEALSVFLNDLPSCRFLDSLDYFIGRALEGQGKSAAAKEAYTKFLKIKASGSDDQAFIEDAKRHLD